MKHATAVFAIFLTVLSGNLFAACPDQATVPHAVSFTFDTSCATTSGDVSSTTMWCYYAANSFDTGSGSADYSMTVPSGYSGNAFSAQVYVEFSDPNSSSNNAVSTTVYVWHNGSLSSYNTFFTHAGNQGSLSCQLVSTGLFSASPGDTIEVLTTATKYNYNTTIQVSTPYIFFNF